MPTFQPSWGTKLEKLTANATQLQAIAMKPTNDVIATFTKIGFAYAILPLQACPKQNREANHLMLQNVHCYLRLFTI